MQAVNELKKFETPLNYQVDKDKIKKFLLFYTENDQFKYLNALRNLHDSIDINLDDISDSCNRPF